MGVPMLILRNVPVARYFCTFHADFKILNGSVSHISSNYKYMKYNTLCHLWSIMSALRNGYIRC